MVPGPAARGPLRRIALTHDGKDRARWEGIGERGLALLEELSLAGPATATALRRRLGEDGSVDYWLRRLATAGLVEVSFRARAEEAPVVESVALRVSPDAARAWPLAPDDALRRGLRIVEALLASREPILYEELRRHAGATRTLLRNLESQGLIAVEARPVSQDLGSFVVEDTITEIAWTEEQRVALDRIVAVHALGGFGVVLLHGATGSGKTFLYMEAARRVVAEGRTALVLVPEIALTPQTVHRFRAAFGDRVAVVHSMLPPAERVGVWREIASGTKRVVIGPRSAVFAPLSDLGLVVVDEEHESAYKQEETPRYHGRDVAIYRARLAGATVLLGSATPSLESTRNAQIGRYERITLARLRELPPVERVDLRTSPPGPARFLSPQLLARIAETTAAGAQTILLLNRRGYAVFLLCESCGYVPALPALLGDVHVPLCAVTRCDATTAGARSGRPRSALCAERSASATRARARSASRRSCSPPRPGYAWRAWTSTRRGGAARTAKSCARSAAATSTVSWARR